MNKKIFLTKLEKKLTVSIIISLAISILISLLINFTGEYMLDTYYDKSNFLNNKSTQALSDFKSYVLKNNISINDHEKIEKWVRNYKYVDIYIFKNNTLVYNSTRYASYSDYETLVETTNISDYFDDISFYDANGKVYMD
ncbi:hypothetical protein [Clostridium butyricum]|nr:MAG: Sensory transduction protein kinase [Clostridium butyricum DORA_1]